MFNVDRALFFTVVSSWLISAACLLSPLISPAWGLLDSAYLFFLFSVYCSLYAFLFVTVACSGKSSFDGYRGVLTRRLYYIAVAAMLIAIFCRGIDRFYLRPVNDFFSIKSYREAREAGTNIISFIGSLALPVFLVACSACFQKLKNLKEKVLLGGGVLLILLDILASGSRGGVLLALVVVFGGLLNFKRGLILGLIFIVASGLFFVYRLGSLSNTADLASALRASSEAGYALFVPYSPLVSSFMAQPEALMYLFPFLQANQYLSHGVFEFAKIFSEMQGFFFDPVHVLPHLSKLFGPPEADIRYGMYYTLAGTSYLAFGYFSIVFMMMLGVFYGVIYRLSEYLGLGVRRLILFSVLLFPFVNSFSGFDFYLYFMAIIVVRVIADHRLVLRLN